jgi:hypothetical protein
LRHATEEDAMTDPREFTERHDANRFTPDVGEAERADGEQRNDAEELRRDADEVGPDGEVEQGPDTNELDADNAVEQDSIETVDPDNAPA